ncbi:restriction endonuclease subunit S [Gaetbulibacter aquiaggeris]|uniref:Restriction endonuclease subunit S n=1 Tax=Gaetbulibacter aquiaggeris TaxID=1735373 RepID=A0ABW7MUF3_9FLAO
MNKTLKTTLGQVCDFIGGSQPAKKYFSPIKHKGFIRLIQIRDYKTDNFITYIPKDSTRKFCSKKDIMIGRYGPPIFQILRGIEGAYNVALMKAVPKKDIVNDYLYYFLCQEHLFDYINALSPRTGGQTGVDVVMLKKFPIQLPELSIQKQIAKVLSDLDTKIEVNNKINQELEAMAKTLYDYWFVQFDFPDRKGKPYKLSGGKMDYNKELKRKIPEGWVVKTLLDIATFVNGIACQKFRPNENEDSFRVIKIREMGTGFNENSEFVSVNIPEKVIVYDGDILFSWSATLDVKIWSGGTGGLNQHIFKVTSKKYPKSYYYFELLNYLQHFKMMAELRKTTMGHITQEHLKQSRIVIPPLELIKQLDLKLKTILEQVVLKQKENQKLMELRDWLLPMLMNGQVTVGEAEKELGMVAEDGDKYGKG